MVLNTQHEKGTGFSIMDIHNEILVREVMSKEIFDIELTATVLEVAKMMADNDTGSIIITKEGASVGIITEYDVITKTVVRNVLPADMKAMDIMSYPIITTKPITNIIEAAEIMVRSNIRRLVVMENDTISGMVTDRDIIAIAPGLNTILEGLIELHHEENFSGEQELERGICQRCGIFVDSLSDVNGLMLCDDCKEDEGYYD